MWDEVGPQISAVLQNDGNIPSDVVPFDAASDRDVDEQKWVMMDIFYISAGNCYIYAFYLLWKKNLFFLQVSFKWQR
jgi:hypothetical protein